MINEEEKPIDEKTIVRPRSVTLLAFVVLIIGSLYLIRFIESIRQWNFLMDILIISPMYLVISGFFWASIGSLLVWGLFRGNKWVPNWLKVLSVIFVIYIWLERILLFNQSSRSPNDIFIAILSLLQLVYVYWILTRKDVKEFFGANNER